MMNADDVIVAELVKIANALFATKQGRHVTKVNQDAYNAIAKKFAKALPERGALSDAMHSIDSEYRKEKDSSMITNTFMEAISQAESYRLEKLAKELDRMYGEYESANMTAFEKDNQEIVKNVKFPKLPNWDVWYDDGLDWLQYDAEDASQTFYAAFLDFAAVITGQEPFGEYTIDSGNPYDSRDNRRLERGKWRTVAEIGRIMKNADRKYWVK